MQPIEQIVVLNPADDIAPIPVARLYTPVVRMQKMHLLRLTHPLSPLGADCRMQLGVGLTDEMIAAMGISDHGGKRQRITDLSPVSDMVQHDSAMVTSDGVMRGHELTDDDRNGPGRAVHAFL